MNAPFQKQQILISGVGGQGIVFITRLLAEAAIYKEYPVLTAETHGMAQRGGIVVSHIKVGGFSSPLIRPGKADVLLVLKEENMQDHLFYLDPDGIAVVNARSRPEGPENRKMLIIDADGLANEVQQPKSVNLVLAGFALSALSRISRQALCSPDDIRAILCQKLAGRDKLLKTSVSAFDIGVFHGEKVNI
ncbi:MAG: 2-oxoacid:acceptor oxidoreductase family protein [Dissulfurispiraceae bacterium]